MTFETFITNNNNLIHKIAHKYSIKGYKHEDLYQEGLTKLWEVFNTYDETKGAETTFITTILNNYYYTLREENTRLYNQNYDSNGNMLSDIKNFNFDLLVCTTNSISNDMYYENILNIAYKLLEEEKYKDGFIDLLYGETYQSVAEKYGVSKQNIDQRFKKYLEKVRNTVDELGLK